LEEGENAGGRGFVPESGNSETLQAGFRNASLICDFRRDFSVCEHGVFRRPV
jgi:hypothetical protein